MRQILTLIILMTKVCFGNDGYSAIGAGGIVFKKTNHIDMLNETLTVSENSINVKYDFINRKGISEEKTTEKALIAFPLPDIDCGNLERNEQPKDFSVMVDGKKIKYKTEIKAFKNDQDVTAKVKKVGLPVDCRELEKNKDLFKKVEAPVLKGTISTGLPVTPGQLSPVLNWTGLT